TADEVDGASDRRIAGRAAHPDDLLPGEDHIANGRAVVELGTAVDLRALVDDTGTDSFLALGADYRAAVCAARENILEAAGHKRSITGRAAAVDILDAAVEERCGDSGAVVFLDTGSPDDRITGYAPGLNYLSAKAVRPGSENRRAASYAAA